MENETQTFRLLPSGSFKNRQLAAPNRYNLFDRYLQTYLRGRQHKSSQPDKTFNANQLVLILTQLLKPHPLPQLAEHQ